jgi:hypothetical protein
MPFPAPFGEDFPNLERALSENIPVLCGLLVGFAGLLFVTVATLPDIDKVLHSIEYRPLIVCDPTIASFDGRAFVLWFTGADCLLFYLAVISIIYARMSQYRDLVSEAELRTLRAQEPLVLEEERRLDKRRNRYVTNCMLLFNCAIVSLPFSFVVLLPKRWLQSVLLNLFLLILCYSFWATRRRLVSLFR